MTREVVDRMATIWKYTLAPADAQILEVPAGAKVLHVGPDPEAKACIWFMVDPEQEKENRHIFMIGTGHQIPVEFAGSFVNTIVVGEFVFHIFAPVAVPAG